MRSQNLTYQNIFDEPPFENANQASLVDNQNAFTAINEQLSTMLDKINNKPNIEAEPVYSNNIHISNIENTLLELSCAVKNIQEQNAYSMQLILEKIANIEANLVYNNQDLQNFKSSQHQEFINLHSNFNQQVQAILDIFEQNVRNAITEEKIIAKNTPPRCWEEALENLFNS